MADTELIAGLREYAEVAARVNEIAGVTGGELTSNYMRMCGRYIDADAWMGSNASAIAEELERLRGENERIRKILSRAFCTINKLTTHSIRDSQSVEDDAVDTLTSIAFEIESQPSPAKESDRG